MQSKKTSTIILRVDDELKKAIQQLADADSRKLGDYIRLQLQKLVEANKAK
jgi:predicted transcriptional regulator